MLSTTEPSHERVRKFLIEQRELAYSYAEIGQSKAGTPCGYDVDHNRFHVGQGAADFQAACLALSQWKMFPKGWTKIMPNTAPLREGIVVAMLARVFGLWWLNACRIVYEIDENGERRRFGFAYGTLPGHVECGEERFSIEQLEDGSVWYDIRAFSRPRHWLVRCAKPIARRLQRRFVRESQLAIQAAVRAARKK
ncbi:MAG: DUF1990 domain-containing protein [Candidatus Didemnitutus sp.]|nr:DUF1990 domain-containing protein [Candidatus Didemnitutus sp.]